MRIMAMTVLILGCGGGNDVESTNDAGVPIMVFGTPVSADGAQPLNANAQLEIVSQNDLPTGG